MIVNSSPGEFLAWRTAREAKAAYREMYPEKTMTNETESTRKIMFGLLEQVKQRAVGPFCWAIAKPVEIFESALEAHLEALRQELKASHEATGELAIQLSEIKTERDELRNKLQAFEFANKNAGEMLRDALATVKRQREFIRTLYTSRKARKSKGSTSGQKNAENVPYTYSRAHAEGFRDAGVRPNPFPPGTDHYLHWAEGAREKMAYVKQNAGQRP